MASIRFASADGTAANPTDAAIRSGQVPAAAANSTWFLNRISDYNRPPTGLRSPDAIERAAEQQARLLAEARQRQQQALQRAIQMGQVPQQAGTTVPMDAGRMADAARLQAQVPTQAEEQEPLSLFGVPMTGPLGRAISSVARDPFGWLTEPAPNFGVTTDPMGNPLRPQTDTSGISPTMGPDRPGYTQRPVMDGNGNIIGYEYEKLMEVVTPTKEEVSAAAQPGSQLDRSGGLTGYVSIYDEVNALEQSFSVRKTKVAEDVWGKPVEVENPDGSTTLQWGTNGMEYLGLEPGQVVAPTPRRPADDAPYSEWVKYRDRLRRQIRKPLYSPDSLDSVFNDLGVSGVRQFQRAALGARLYDTNDVVTLGNLSMKDYQIMQALMEQANLNGTTWEEQLELQAQAAATQAQTTGGGGGGGGGGGTSVYTQITYNQTSMAQARTILTAVLQEALGRRPSEQELADFIAMLNEAEAKDPTKTVTRTTTAGDRTRSVARTTPGAVDPQEMAREFAADIGGGAPMTAKRETDYLMGYLNSLGGMA